MLKLLADENFNSSIVRGLLLKRPEMDIVRVQDIGMSGAEDTAILEVAAEQNRTLLTHDYRTIPRSAYERIEAGLPMAGVVLGKIQIPVHQAIEDILLLAGSSEDDEWQDQILYLPL